MRRLADGGLAAILLDFGTASCVYGRMVDKWITAINGTRLTSARR